MALVMIGARGNLSIAVEAHAKGAHDDAHIFVLVVRDVAAGMEVRLALTPGETARLAVEAGRAAQVHASPTERADQGRWLVKTSPT